MIFSNLYTQIINIFRSYTRHINKTIDKQKLKKEIDILEQELSMAYYWFYAFMELQNQINLNEKIYEKYSHFFYTVYLSFYNELIHKISHLHDTSQESLSIVKLLKEFEKNSVITTFEKKWLSQIEDSQVKKKIKAVRNKLGRAHLDRKCSINLDKQNILSQEYTIKPQELLKYLRLLKKALDEMALRLDQHDALLEPTPTLGSKISEMFKKLNNE